MERIKFPKTEQRIFLKKVMEKLDCFTLRELTNRMGINYSTAKNYFSEKRFLPLDLFGDLCYISKIDKNSLKFEILKENFGKIIGGKKSKREKI